MSYEAWLHNDHESVRRGTKIHQYRGDLLYSAHAEASQLSWVVIGSAAAGLLGLWWPLCFVCGGRCLGAGLATPGFVGLVGLVGGDGFLAQSGSPAGPDMFTRSSLAATPPCNLVSLFSSGERTFQVGVADAMRM